MSLMPEHRPADSKPGQLTADEREALRECRLFAGCQPAVFKIAESLATARSVAHSAMLLEPGEPNEYVYVVVEGQIGVYRDSALQDVLARFVRGDVLGEHALLNPDGGSVFVASQWPSRVLSFHGPELRRLMTHAPQIALNLLDILSERLRNANHRLDAAATNPDTSPAFLATHDAVTGLHNRRWMLETFQRELDRRAHEKSPVALLIVDLDHFDQINQAVGRSAADSVLKQVADIIRRTVRPADLYARVAADRYAILLPGAELEDARQVADRLRQQIAGRQYPLRGRLAIQVTASVGIAPGGSELEPTLERAEAALAQAKEDGRNRVAVATG